MKWEVHVLQSAAMSEREKMLTDYSGGSDSHDITRFGEEAAEYIHRVRTLATHFSFRVNELAMSQVYT